MEIPIDIRYGHKYILIFFIEKSHNWYYEVNFKPNSTP